MFHNYGGGIVYNVIPGNNSWTGEICKLCFRRNCVGFNVPDDIWKKVSKGRWNILCTSCFDEEAEKEGIVYSFGEVFPVSWSDSNHE